MSPGGRPLEELESSASCPATCSIDSNSRCFAIRSSEIASITQSASFTAWSRLRACTNSSTPRSTIPWLARPEVGAQGGVGGGARRGEAGVAAVLGLVQIHREPLLLEREQAGMRRLGDREHVVHDAALQAFLSLVELHVEPQRVLDPHRLR